MGKIRMAEKAKEPIPPSWAVTAQGLPTTNPTEAIAGMLLPSGGAKGFGLSFLIDLLCGLLSQGATGAQVRPLYGDFSVPYDCSHLFIAIDVAHFCELDWFRAQAAKRQQRVFVTASEPPARAAVHAGRAGMAAARPAPAGRSSWIRRGCDVATATPTVSVSADSL